MEIKYGERKTAGQGEYWKPENAGDKLEGVFVGVLEGDYGKSFKIKNAEGKVVITPTLTVLEDRFTAIPINNYVWIEYLGEGESKQKGRNPPKLFNVDYAEPEAQQISPKE